MIGSPENNCLVIDPYSPSRDDHAIIVIPMYRLRERTRAAQLDLNISQRRAAPGELQLILRSVPLPIGMRRLASSCRRSRRRVGVVGVGHGQSRRANWR